VAIPRNIRLGQDFAALPGSDPGGQKMEAVASIGLDLIVTYWFHPVLKLSSLPTRGDKIKCSNWLPARLHPRLVNPGVV